MMSFQTILLVEDNPGDARLVRELLKERDIDCQLRHASTLAEAQEVLEHMVPDIILLDLGLPDSLGLDAYTCLSKAAPRTPIVILTGDDDDEKALEALRVGAADYLAKQDADGVRLVRTLRHAVRRRMNAEELLDSAARLRAIVLASEEGIVMLNRSGQIQFMNTRAAELLGLDESRCRQLCQEGTAKLRRWVAPEQRGQANQLLRTVVGERDGCELLLQRDDGTTRWVYAVASGIVPLPDETSELVLLLTDISERKLAEAELARVRQELETRIAERTAVLDTIQLDMRRLAQAVSQRQPPGSPAKVPQPEPATPPDAPTMMSGLLTLAALRRQPLQRRTLDLSAMAEAVVADLRQAEPGRDADIAIEPGLVEHGDQDLVDGLLRRLLDNAWKFTRPGAGPTRITLSAVRSERSPPVYRLQDNGIGFDLAGAVSLFEPFQRMASAQGLPGIGLGLSVARNVVERHGGRIWAESSPGAGSTFYFTLQAPASRHSLPG